MIQIKPRIIDGIYRHAISEYPGEACGIIIGKKDVPDSFELSFPCKNLQDEMNAKDPERFPRTSKMAYFLNPKDLFQVQRMARERGMDMKIIYHSHVDVGAYFSEEDKKQATYEGNPLYPGVRYLVVDPAQEKTRWAKLLGWDEFKKDFLELAWSE